MIFFRLRKDFHKEIGFYSDIGSKEGFILGVVNGAGHFATEELVFGRVGGVPIVLIAKSDNLSHGRILHNTCCITVKCIVHGMVEVLAKEYSPMTYAAKVNE